MKVGSPVGVKELNEQQLDQMARGAFEANTPQETDFDDPSFDTIISLPMVIVDEGLGEIIDIHYQQRYEKLKEDETPRSIKGRMIRSYKCNINDESLTLRNGFHSVISVLIDPHYLFDKVNKGYKKNRIK